MIIQDTKISTHIKWFNNKQLEISEKFKLYDNVLIGYCDYSYCGVRLLDACTSSGTTNAEYIWGHFANEKVKKGKNNDGMEEEKKKDIANIKIVNYKDVNTSLIIILKEIKDKDSLLFIDDLINQLVKLKNKKLNIILFSSIYMDYSKSKDKNVGGLRYLSQGYDENKIPKQAVKLEDDVIICDALFNAFHYLIQFVSIPALSIVVNGPKFNPVDGATQKLVTHFGSVLNNLKLSVNFNKDNFSKTKYDYHAKGGSIYL